MYKYVYYVNTPVVGRGIWTPLQLELVPLDLHFTGTNCKRFSTTSKATLRPPRHCLSPALPAVFRHYVWTDYYRGCLLYSVLTSSLSLSFTLPSETLQSCKSWPRNRSTLKPCFPLKLFKLLSWVQNYILNKTLLYKWFASVHGACVQQVTALSSFLIRTFVHITRFSP